MYAVVLKALYHGNKLGETKIQENTAKFTSPKLFPKLRKWIWSNFMLLSWFCLLTLCDFIYKSYSCYSRKILNLILLRMSIKLIQYYNTFTCMNNVRKKEEISNRSSVDSFFAYYIPSLFKVHLQRIIKPTCNKIHINNAGWQV